MQRISTSGLVALSILLVATVAPAQNAKKAAAIVAFDEAQSLMESGELAEACKKYGQSHRLDPQLGTLLHWAHCLEQIGHTASAWAGFREAAELAEAKGDSRKAVAEERADALLPRLSQLKLDLPADMPPGTKITRAGVPIEADLWSVPTPVDPGTYAIEVSAPGYLTWRKTVEVKGEGQVVDLEIPPLEPEGEPSTAPSASAESTVTPAVEVAPVEQTSRLWRAKWPAFLAGGVGVAGAAIWTIYGLRSLDAKGKADDVCDGLACQTEQGRAWRDQAYELGNVATLGMVITGVGVASAAALWFALPSPSAGDTQVGVGPGTVAVQGSF